MPESSQKPKLPIMFDNGSYIRSPVPRIRPSVVTVYDLFRHGPYILNRLLIRHTRSNIQALTSIDLAK
jgi:hypothetical protein